MECSTTLLSSTSQKSSRLSVFLQHEFGTKPGVDASGFRADLHFGSGRRLCPGTILANSTLSINTVNLLWAFNYRMPDLATRDPCTPITYQDFEPSLVFGPKPFRCDVTVRSEGHADLIRSSYAQARSVFAVFEQELTPKEATKIAA
ncbi:hypothetical protein K474DRAFT_1654927 [Panus rudis PR-1116 ss-1]|nr:hypothetical protein K474DRAFT_1654927 [Panus rudis PR-1116 ss-1]